MDPCTQTQAPWPGLRSLLLLVLGLVGGLVGACGGGSGPVPGPIHPSGDLVARPDGGYFLADPHRGGLATRLRLLEIQWGRLVDVHDVDERGLPSVLPVLRDLLIDENVLDNGTDTEITTNPITHRTRLIVAFPRLDPRFADALRRATAGLGALAPKNDDGTAPLPFSYVPRNAALLLRFDDLLDDDQTALGDLVETVRLSTGYPPNVPTPARIVFDPNHGGVSGGEFHSTRVLVDFTVSQEEAASLPAFTPVNAIGLAPSSSTSPVANAEVRLPTLLDPSNGRFVRLKNLAGGPLRAEGPMDRTNGDLVRAWRAGNNTDINAGFLLDLDRPRVVGALELTVDAARDDPLGVAGRSFLVDLGFTTICRAAPQRGDALELGGGLFEVQEDASPPDELGRVLGARVQTVGEAQAQPQGLLGRGRLLTPFRRGVPVPLGCWLTILPEPGEPPVDRVSSDSQVRVRFSEPMDPETFRSFDSFRVLRGSGEQEVLASELVVGKVIPGAELQDFTFTPSLPFANHNSREYTFDLVGGIQGVRDLAGNVLAEEPGRVGFLLDADEPRQANGGLALRFQEPDEIAPPGLPDIRGQVRLLDGLLTPRLPARGSATLDRFSAIPMLMLPFGPGVQTPLNPLGSKLQALWRYCDFDWRVSDENFHNLDLVGMSWSPNGGSVFSDFYPRFEMRMVHSRFLPDETQLSSQAPKYPDSGLRPGPFPYTENLLSDPRGPQRIVHSQALGYRVNPSDRFSSPGGTPLMPFPWNRSGGPQVSFTWRDTAVLAKGGAGGPGIPMDIEIGAPLFLEQNQGSLGAPGQVPTIGLPLLWEIRCYPTTSALGLNALDILLPVPGFPLPNYRAFSSGGIDNGGSQVLKDPDLEIAPTGGFNPNSRPPGNPTPLNADNSVYVGQIDFVTRISRAHTIWIDSGAFAPRFVTPVVEPRTQPPGTSVVLEFRGAEAFDQALGQEPFDAARLDPYGDFFGGTPEVFGDGQWTGQLENLSGARYFQVRFSFISDVESRLSPVLDSLGIAFEE